MRISKFKTDATAESKGTWVDIGDGAKLLVARAGGSNKAYRDFVDAQLKPYRRQIQQNTLSNDIFETVTINALAETVLLGWAGIQDDDGTEIQFTKATAKQLLKELPDFRDVVSNIANEMSSFRREEVAEDADTLKNA